MFSYYSDMNISFELVISYSYYVVVICSAFVGYGLVVGWWQDVCLMVYYVIVSVGEFKLL